MSQSPIENLSVDEYERLIDSTNNKEENSSAKSSDNVQDTSYQPNPNQQSSSQEKVVPPQPAHSVPNHQSIDSLSDDSDSTSDNDTERSGGGKYYKWGLVVDTSLRYPPPPEWDDIDLSEIRDYWNIQKMVRNAPSIVRDMYNIRKVWNFVYSLLSKKKILIYYLHDRSASNLVVKIIVNEIYKKFSFIPKIFSHDKDGWALCDYIHTRVKNEDFEEMKLQLPENYSSGNDINFGEISVDDEDDYYLGARKVLILFHRHRDFREEYLSKKENREPIPLETKKRRRRKRKLSIIENEIEITKREHGEQEEPIKKIRKRRPRSYIDGDIISISSQISKEVGTCDTKVSNESNTNANNDNNNSDSDADADSFSDSSQYFKTHFGNEAENRKKLMMDSEANLIESFENMNERVSDNFERMRNGLYRLSSNIESHSYTFSITLEAKFLQKYNVNNWMI